MAKQLLENFVEDTKIEAPPRSSESLAGQEWLLNFLKSFGPAGSTTKLPSQGVAGLSTLQQELLGFLQQGQAGSQERLDLAGGEITKTLSGNYDPRTSDLFKGLSQDATRTKAKGRTRIRQIANQGGMLASSPTVKQEADFSSEVDSQLLSNLGGLFESDRERKLGAASATPGSEGERADVAGQALGVADLERNIEQARNDALLAVAMQQLLFPYQQAQIALGMLNDNPGSAVTGGGPTSLGFGMALAGEAIQTYFQMKSGGKK